jgi:hypothetical protein
VRRVIDAQVARIAGRGVDPLVGDLALDVAPWVDWGPMLWDPALLTFPADFKADCTHPEASGRQKLGALLLSFFGAKPWFRP